MQRAPFSAPLWDCSTPPESLPQVFELPEFAQGRLQGFGGLRRLMRAHFSSRFEFRMAASPHVTTSGSLVAPQRTIGGSTAAVPPQGPTGDAPPPADAQAAAVAVRYRKGPLACSGHLRTGADAATWAAVEVDPQLAASPNLRAFALATAAAGKVVPALGLSYRGEQADAYVCLGPSRRSVSCKLRWGPLTAGVEAQTSSSPAASPDGSGGPDSDLTLGSADGLLGSGPHVDWCNARLSYGATRRSARTGQPESIEASLSLEDVGGTVCAGALYHTAAWSNAAGRSHWRNLALGLELVHTLPGSRRSRAAVSVAGLYQFDRHAAVKARVASDASLDTAVVFRVAPAVTAALSCGVNVRTSRATAGLCLSLAP